MFENYQLMLNPVEIIGYEWKAEQPVAVVCLIHGIGEHAGRYDRIGEAFKKSGIALVGMDLRGHGLSAGKRGHAAPRKEILTDIDMLLLDIQKKYTEVPIFVYGHSMGGNIALDYRRRGRFRTVPKAYLITSPWLILQRNIPKYLYELCRMISKIKPDFQMNSKIEPSVLGNVDLISKQEHSELVHGKITVQTALDGIGIAEALMNNTLEIFGAEALKPFLLMHGSADKICDPQGSRIIARLEKDLCEYVEWEGLFHEIHNGNATSEGTEVIQSMIEWIKKELI